MLALDLIRRAYQQLEQRLQHHKERRRLLELNDHLLKDMGLSRDDARREGEKPFWRD